RHSRRNKALKSRTFKSITIMSRTLKSIIIKGRTPKSSSLSARNFLLSLISLSRIHDHHGHHESMYPLLGDPFSSPWSEA
ncbi:hypothetical protein BGZ68_010262, partial [Mortierella alpina]